MTETRDEAAIRERPWVAMGLWVALDTGRCNCAGGTAESSYIHENYCSLEPLCETKSEADAAHIVEDHNALLADLARLRERVGHPGGTADDPVFVHVGGCTDVDFPCQHECRCWCHVYAERDAALARAEAAEAKVRAVEADRDSLKRLVDANELVPRIQQLRAERDAMERYALALARGLSDAEARAEGWPSAAAVPPPEPQEAKP